MIKTPASAITKAASKQAYHTIRFLVDRDRVADAYRAYAYFRWVDDVIDTGSRFAAERIAFLLRQKSLLDNSYRGQLPHDSITEEKMLIQLIQNDHEKFSGLQIYLRNMMNVMEFDAERRGRLISEAELEQYTCWLTSAVTEAMHYFIGHEMYAPQNENRYLAVAGAHIVHMLRDAYEDVKVGYYNVPREVLEAAHIQPQDIGSRAYRDWVRGRVQLAREYLTTGREYIAQVEEPRCQLAGFAYVARFEWLLNTIEREAFVLRPEYGDRKSFRTKLQMGISTVSSMIHSKSPHSIYKPVTSNSWRNS